LDLLSSSFDASLSFFCIGTVNLSPFHTFRSDPWSLMILAGNIVLFLPLGFFPPLFSKDFSYKKLLLYGLSTTLFIESFQLFIGRSFDIDDLFLNFSGILLGRFLFSHLPNGFVSRFRPQPLK